MRAEPSPSCQPGPLAPALLAFARQEGLQLVAPSALLADRQTRGCGPAKDVEQALARLFEGTGLRYRRVGRQTLVVEPQPLPSATRTPAASLALEEVTVTGSLIRASGQFSRVQPVLELSAGRWEADATRDTSVLLQSLVQNAGSDGWVHNLLQPFMGGAANVNLRNLGVGAALILVDGHRQATASVTTLEGSTFVDLNLLPPLIALERVEVLLDGASATYGSDAVAGVVNLLPRRDLDGGELQVDTQWRPGSDYGNGRLAWVQGQQQDGWRWLQALELSASDAMPASERDFTHGTAWSMSGHPGTFITSRGTVPDPSCGIAGTRREGNDCLFDSAPYFDVSPREQRARWYGRLDGESGAWQWHAQASLAQAELTLAASPSYPFARQLPVVPVDNPGNLFGEPVRLQGRVLGAGADASRSDTRYTYGFAALGGERALDRHRLTLSLSGSEHRARYGREDVLYDRVQAALDGRGGPDGNQTWNPLYGAANPAGLVDSFFADWKMRGKSSLFTADAGLDSDWFRAGAVSLAYAVGGQWRQERFFQDYADAYNQGRFLSLGSGPDFGGDQSTGALFGELRGELGALSGQLSARFDEYNGGQRDLTPKLALRWQPTEGLALRGTLGHAFRAPSVFQTATGHSAPRPLEDPLHPGTLQYYTVSTSGNTDLTPETAHIATLGLSLTTDGAQLDLDAWQYHYQDLIARQSPQSVLARAAAGDPAMRAQVIRDPLTGALQQVRTRFVNAASLQGRGVDLRGSLHLPSPLPGEWRLLGEASYVERFRLREEEDGDWQSVVGHRNTNNLLARPLPRWRGAVRLQWEYRQHQLQLASHYVHGYRDDNRDGATVTSHTWLDLGYRWRIPSRDGELEWGLAIHNLLDRDPPALDEYLGYDPSLHDPRGRLLQASLHWRY